MKISDKYFLYFFSIYKNVKRILSEKQRKAFKNGL